MQDHTPLSGVPDDGDVALQLAEWKKSGAVNVQVAVATPDRSSVSVMLQATVAEAEVVLIAAGEKLNPVRSGAVVSQTARTGDHDTAENSTAASEKPSRERRWDMVGPSLRFRTGSIR